MRIPPWLFELGLDMGAGAACVLVAASTCAKGEMGVRLRGRGGQVSGQDAH